MLVWNNDDRHALLVIAKCHEAREPLGVRYVVLDTSSCFVQVRLKGKMQSAIFGFVVVVISNKVSRYSAALRI